MNPIHSGERTHNHDRFITLANFSPTNKIVKSDINEVPDVILV